MSWSALFLLLGALLMGWLLYRQIKGNPQNYSKENISKSLYTLGILALLLICFIGFLVLLLRTS